VSAAEVLAHQQIAFVLHLDREPKPGGGGLRAPVERTSR
jgi:hypothetical protein